MTILSFLQKLKQLFAWLPWNKRTNAWSIPANAIVAGRIITMEQLLSWGVPESELWNLHKAFVGKRHTLRAMKIDGEDCYRVMRIRYYGERRIK